MTVATIWRFRTRNFTIIVDCDWENDPDLSWDDTGEVAEKLDSGELGNYCFRARVLGPRGEELSADYLGNSIHADPADFRDHIGMQGKYGSYFTSMVREAIADARHEVRCLHDVKVRSV